MGLAKIIAKTKRRGEKKCREAENMVDERNEDRHGKER
jgi:hypothetical protein